MNQFYGVLAADATDLSKNCGWFVGDDVDFFCGSDFFFTTAAGLDGTKRRQRAALEYRSERSLRLFHAAVVCETDYDDLRIKWGHFYTIIGYEVVPAIGNFFYTHSYTMQYGEPFTHTGVLASRNINDNWSWSGGVVGGWNDFCMQEGAQFLGGLTYTGKDCGSLAFSIVTGNESDFNVPGVSPESNRTMYSVVWTQHSEQPLDVCAAARLGRATEYARLQCRRPKNGRLVWHQSIFVLQAQLQLDARLAV